MSKHPGSSTAENVGDEAREKARAVSDHPWFVAVARCGFVMSGLVHALIGWICLRMGLSSGSGSGGSADQSGALAEIAQAPAGAIVLGVGAVAMVALAFFYLLDAVVGDGARKDGAKRWASVGKSVGKAVVYLVLASTAARFAMGGRSSSGDQTQSATSGLLGSAAGRTAVVVAGLVVIGVGAYHVLKGVTQKFKEDLSPSGEASVGRAITVSGVIGYVAKGVTLGGVGAMLVWAALSTDPSKARGMDAAFRETAQLPAGGVLLGAAGLGFLLYGVYSVLRARYQEM